MTNHMSPGIWIILLQHPNYVCQCLILDLFIGFIIRPFQLNPYGKVIAIFAPKITGFARMPGPSSKRHELHYLTIATDQQMRGNLQMGNRLEIRMLPGIQCVGKELLDVGAAKLARWQTDAVNHDQADITAIGAFIEIGRRTTAG